MIAVGETYGRLTVIGVRMHASGKRYGDCLCSCGKTKSVRQDHLQTGKTSSCGCWHDEAASLNNIKHGHKKRGRITAEYSAWCSMNQRCRDAADKYYGSRGIVVCAEWQENFEAFLSHIGKRPSPAHSVDRIDVNGNYEPGNVRWATPIQQASNKRNSALLEFNGIVATITDWSRRVGIGKGVIARRIAAGWPPSKALTEPVSFKLNEAKVRSAIERSLAGESRSSIARSFGVSYSLISHLVLGKCWKRLTRNSGVTKSTRGRWNNGHNRKVAV